MAFYLNVDGMEIYLNINDYVKTNSDNWDSTWCRVDFSFKFLKCINYSKSNDEVLLACEIESLEKSLTDLLEHKINKKMLLSFIEPDFNFELYPRHLITDEDPNVVYVKPGYEAIDVSAEWTVNLWSEGALTANYFSVALDRNEITQLRDYLRTVLSE